MQNSMKVRLRDRVDREGCKPGVSQEGFAAEVMQGVLRC